MAHHQHHHHHDLVDKNREYWNTASKSVFKEQWIQDLQQQITQFLQTNIEWIGISESADSHGKESTKMLDYACGNGIPSLALSPHFKSCVGCDVSEGMIEKYNAAARERGLSEKQMHGVCGDLMTSDLASSLLGEDFFDFDLVVICMALHHLEDPHEAVKRLVERLRKGGIFLVIDWATSSEKYQRQLRKSAEAGEDANAHDHDHGPGQYPAAHTVAHDSFAREQMEEAFRNAGCGSVDFVLHPQPSEVPMAAGGQMQLFFARGRKDIV